MNVPLADDACRRDFRAILNLMQYEDSSSDNSGSDEDDRDLLLLELVFAPKILPGPRLNLLDLSNLQCEQLFRYVAANTNI